jgi:hypothetical protein
MRCGTVADDQMLTHTRTWVIALAFLCAATAAATLLTWRLQGVTFDDGGAASGSFAYDATANLYSSFNIVTTTGSVRTGATYLFVNPNAFISNATNLAVVTQGSGDLTGTPWYDSVFVVPLTNAGGTVAIDLVHGGGEATCAPPLNCPGTVAPNRFFTAGVVTTVPEPSTFRLLTLGLAAIVASPRPIRFTRRVAASPYRRVG